MDLPNLIYISIGIIGCIALVSASILMRNRLRSNIFFSLILGCMLFTWAFLICFSIIFENDPVNLYKYMVIALFPVNIIYLTAYLYFELLLNKKPPLWRFLFFFEVCIIISTLQFLTLFEIYVEENIFSLTYSVGIIICIFVFYVLKKTMKISKHRALKNDLLAIIFMFMGSILYSLHGLLVYMGFYERFTLISAVIYGTGGSFFISSIFILALNSRLHGDYYAILPVEVYSILIYNKAGLLAYHKNVSSKTESIYRSPEELVSAAFMAFSTFFKDTLGTNAKLTYINAKDYEFLFSELPNESGTMVILTSKANYFMMKSLRNFTRTIPADVLKEINKPGMGENVDLRIQKLLQEHFRYLKF